MLTYILICYISYYVYIAIDYDKFKKYKLVNFSVVMGVFAPILIPVFIIVLAVIFLKALNAALDIVDSNKD